MRTKRFSRASIALAVGALAALLPHNANTAHAATAVFDYPCSSGGSTTGDFNNDGLPDLAIGAPGDDVEQIEVDGSITRAGEDVGSINVVYSTSANGPDVNNAAGGSPKFFAQNSAGIDDDSEKADTFGFSLAAGDFDGQNGDDLAVGVPGENGNKGAVHVLYSAAAGLGTLNDRLFSQDTPGIDGVAESGDLFGYAVAAGDVNNDGKDDLVVGAPREDFARRKDAGVVHVIYGSSNGLSPGATRSDQVFEQGPGRIRSPEIGRAESGDLFGASLVVAQLNQSGPADIAVGAPGEDVGRVPDAGAVRVLYSKPAGADISNADFIHTGGRGVEGGPESGDRFGCALAAGDFDGDHGVVPGSTTPTAAVHDDDEELAVGTPGEGVGGEDDAGVLSVFYNTSASGLIDGTRNDPASDELWTENSDIPGVAKANDRMGGSLASADFNGDKVDDLAIGLPTELLFDNKDAGSVRVLNGFAGDGLDDTKRTAFGQSPSDPESNCWLYGIFGSCGVGPPDYSPLYMVEEEGDKFGASLAAADFDGDGKADLAIGAPGEDLGQFVNWLTEEEATIPDELLTNFGIPVPLGIDEIPDAGIVHVVMGAFPSPKAPPAAGEQDLIYRDSGGRLNSLRNGLQQIPLFADNEIKPADPLGTSVLNGDAFGHDQS